MKPNYGDFVILNVLINGHSEEMVKLEYCGLIGQNQWLHFINRKTGENHLVKEDQFPQHIFKMDGNLIELKYA